MCVIRYKSLYSKVKVGIHWLVCPLTIYLPLNFSIFFSQVIKLTSRSSMIPKYRLRIGRAVVLLSRFCSSARSSKCSYVPICRFTCSMFYTWYLALCLFLSSFLCLLNVHLLVDSDKWEFPQSGGLVQVPPAVSCTGWSWKHDCVIFK